MVELERYLEMAVKVAHEAGRLTLGYFQRDLQVDVKGDDSPVTIADRGAEELIRARLADAFPSHGQVGEEFGDEAGGRSHVWWIDPIDGTKAFIRGVPLYAVLIGLAVEGRVEVGVAHFPALGETLYAASGRGTHLNGRRVWVAKSERLSDAFVGFTNARAFADHGRARAWARVQANTAHQAGWSDAYGHALVASGRLEVMLDPVMNPWDCGPFPVLLREAGGRFGDWSGVETLFGGEAVSVSAQLWPQLAPLIAERDT
jgi:myo-inositol-1(or 4)-monophosphatase